VTVQWGVVLPQGWRSDLRDITGAAAQFEAMVGVAREADRLGYDSVWLYDHLQAVSGELDTTFECWTSLAAIARETARVRLGQIVTCNSFRNPALLAKMAATLDAASAGRAILGLGAGWDEREYGAYGFEQPYPSTGERLRRLEDAARIVKAMLRSEVSSVTGRHHSVRGAANVPTAPQVPLLIGGSGEKVTLRIVAEHADACNLTDSTDPEFYRHKLRILADHCAASSRDYDSIRRTASFSVFMAETERKLDRLVQPHLRGRERAELAAGSAVGTPAQLVDIFGALVEAGIQEFVLYFHAPTDIDRLELFATEVVPNVA
jgi:alkanesulfonate monooxygenase SsuD/methylene tetrahydromethanopterin reductase-like flavin-dependent oxidoreductase (luciferase family)